MVVGEEPGADVYGVDTVDVPFGAGYWLEVFALGNYCANNAIVVFVGHGFNQHMRKHYRNA